MIDIVRGAHARYPNLLLFFFFFKKVTLKNCPYIIVKDKNTLTWIMSKELKVRCLEKYARQFADELSMDENEELIIKRTSMCTWWYARNSHGLEGLVPMHQLEIIEGEFIDYSDLSPAEFKVIENTVFAWKIEKVTQLIFQNQKNNSEEQSTLLHALRKLYSLVNNPDQRYFFMQQQGIDRLLTIATQTYDIAIQLFCLRNVIYLLGTPDAKRFPTQMDIPQGSVFSLFLIFILLLFLFFVFALFASLCVSILCLTAFNVCIFISCFMFYIFYAILV